MGARDKGRRRGMADVREDGVIRRVTMRCLGREGIRGIACCLGGLLCVVDRVWREAVAERPRRAVLGAWSSWPETQRGQYQSPSGTSSRSTQYVWYPMLHESHSSNK